MREPTELKVLAEMLSLSVTRTQLSAVVFITAASFQSTSLLGGLSAKTLGGGVKHTPSLTTNSGTIYPPSP